MKFNLDLEENVISESKEDAGENEKEKLLDYYFPDTGVEGKGIVEGSQSSSKENRESSEKERWNPKKWKVEYEKIVLMDIMGMKGYEIADKIGCTPQHVYNILATDQAMAIQKAMVGRIRHETFDISKEINEIQNLTVKRLKECLKDEDVFKTGRLGFISKGIDVMKGTGEHLKNAPSTQINNQFTIPPSVADRFLLGLEKADKARLMLNEKNNQIEDAEIVSET